MKLHEYQSKEILARYGVAVSGGRVAGAPEEIEEAVGALAAEGVRKFVVKAQVHAGGRGKGGGVKVAASAEEAVEKARQILGMQLRTPQTGTEGRLVRKVLISEAVAIAKEYYLGVTLDRQRSRTVIMASAEGGMDIEEVAAVSPEKILKVWIDPGVGLQPFQVRQIVYGLGMEGDTAKQAMKLVAGIVRTYEETDSSLVEINPLVVTEGGDVLALDAKISLDDNALYRQPDLLELRDVHEEEPLEIEASKHNLNYVRLDGNVGCMVNGAGLAMATMDIIKLAGGEPANFLDVGGGANVQTVEAGFRIILEDKNVEVVLVNIFGGIVRGDRVARGVVEAARNVGIHVPLIVRLQGTNAREGLDILAESGLEIETAVYLEEAAERVTRALERVRSEKAV